MTDHLRSLVLGAALLACVFAAVSPPALADPYDYRDRRDTITSSAGNANAANIATHTINPWPPYAKNSRINLDGRRAAIAITRYQQNKSIDPKGLENTAISIQMGPGGQSGTALTK